jgi:hypothetical protein
VNGYKKRSIPVATRVAHLIVAVKVFLAEGGPNSMVYTRPKAGAAMFVATAILALGAGVFTLRAFSAGQKEVAAQAKAKDEKPAIASPKKENPQKNETLNLEIWQTAWGRPIDGLQAGISFRLGEKPVWHIGEAATFVLYLQNVSKKSITVSYSESLSHKSPPTVLDKQGKEQDTIAEGIEGGRDEPHMRTEKLAAGESIRLDHPWFMIYDDQMEDENHVGAPSLNAAPGKYRVRYDNLKLRRAGKTIDDGEGISTGQIEFEIRPARKP